MTCLGDRLPRNRWKHLPQSRRKLLTNGWSITGLLLPPNTGNSGAVTGSMWFDLANLWAYSRPASTEELTLAVRLIQKHGLRAFARALLNSYEFLYLD